MVEPHNWTYAAYFNDINKITESDSTVRGESVRQDGELRIDVTPLTYMQDTSGNKYRIMTEMRH